MKFRYDINGLRAVAVIAVLFFHFSPSWLPGGFAGVDVFFVISGFLMTAIIFRGLENDTFNIVRFYLSRALRIVPALFVLCVFLVVFGWFYFVPSYYKILGEHICRSIIFVSNMTYMKELGYFNSGSYEKWLLQTWSLSVEWQFYLFYPIILLGLKRILSLKNIKIVVLVLTIVSFIASIYLTLKRPDYAYFSFRSRAWEMLVGGLAYLYPISRKLEKSFVNGKILGVIGMACIGLSYIFYSQSSGWPGYLAVLPVMGAYLTILSNNQESIISRSRICQAIGKWSYSIYLWHWPIAVYLYMSPFKGWLFSVLGMLVSILVGYLSFRYVENARLIKSDRKYTFLYPVVMIIVVFSLGKAITHYNGFNSNYKLVHEYEAKLKFPKYCHVDSDNVDNETTDLYCKLGDADAEPKVLLWGDSYAGHLDPFLMNILPSGNSVISINISGCFPSLDHDRKLSTPKLASYCRQAKKIVKNDLLENKYKVVFIAGRWEYYGKDGIPEIIESIKFAGKHANLVYVFAQPVLYKNPVSNTFMRHKISSLFGGHPIRNDAEADDFNREIQNLLKTADLKNVIFVDRSILYGSDTIPDYLENGLPFTYDEGHLNEHGSVKFAENFRKTPEYGRFLEVMKSPQK